ncbi:hypothetical protein HAN_3g490 (nucleomorph) [Hemiselmis andersenii]|uniref:Uncharacterized protein n=1 Tax=Hemiselmis andersenii TaxID=464988 RepID=A9BLA9_HEMAN|nr:hypothetical protein HAN_3g490 [Hemiselmis andersenii]ABW98292.1 hypothetical protein HAN_3g490 [Hemiselmis andersenii]|mmetsp:Transcript_20739/g.47872  ORF Transcript_20739/g.47872 Transcript_20739/m.47872 type:complete len:137 (-) Transcript_20739:112-522(-)
MNFIFLFFQYLFLFKKIKRINVISKNNIFFLRIIWLINFLIYYLPYFFVHWAFWVIYTYNLKSLEKILPLFVEWDFLLEKLISRYFRTFLVDLFFQFFFRELFFKIYFFRFLKVMVYFFYKFFHPIIENFALKKFF